MISKYKIEDSQINELFSNHFNFSLCPANEPIEITPGIFSQKCEELVGQYSDKRKHAEILRDFYQFAKFTEDPNYSQEFLQRGIHSYLLFKLNEEINQEFNPIDQNFNLKYLGFILLNIQIYSYHSIEIMEEFTVQDIFSCLFFTLNFLIRRRCDSNLGPICTNIYLIFSIILNYFSEIKITGYNVNVDNLLKFCLDELSTSDDIDIETIIIKNFSTFLIRFDVFNDDVRKAIFESFEQILNKNCISLFNEVLFTLTSFAKIEPGIRFIIEDERQLVERFTLCGLEQHNEFIEYNSLILANMLYNALKEDRLIDFHARFPLHRYQDFLHDSKDTQKASLNLLFTIVFNYPDFIESLMNNNVYSSPKPSLKFILNECSFELKEIASHIILRTVLWNNKEWNVYLLQTKLIVLSICTIDSDPSLNSPNSKSLIQLIIDVLLMLLQIDYIKDDLIEQLCENDLFDTITELRSDDDAINQKCDLLRQIVFENEDSE